MEVGCIPMVPSLLPWSNHVRPSRIIWYVLLLGITVISQPRVY